MLYLCILYPVQTINVVDLISDSLSKLKHTFERQKSIEFNKSTQQINKYTTNPTLLLPFVEGDGV